jgi:hypothetical protein
MINTVKKLFKSDQHSIPFPIYEGESESKGNFEITTLVSPVILFCKLWAFSPVILLCRYSPSMNIHMNMAVRAYSRRTYEASHRIGCNKDHEFIEWNMQTICVHRTIFTKWPHFWEVTFICSRFLIKIGASLLWALIWFSHEMRNEYRCRSSIGPLVGWVNYCWPSRGQSFLILCSVGLMTLGVMQMLVVLQTRIPAMSCIYYSFICLLALTPVTNSVECSVICYIRFLIMIFYCSFPRSFFTPTCYLTVRPAAI